MQRYIYLFIKINKTESAIFQYKILFEMFSKNFRFLELQLNHELIYGTKLVQCTKVFFWDCK
jgi:hypothetical protein